MKKKQPGVGGFLLLKMTPDLKIRSEIRNTVQRLSPSCSIFLAPYRLVAVNMSGCSYRYGTLPGRSVSGASHTPTTATLTVGLWLTLFPLALRLCRHTLVTGGSWLTLLIHCASTQGCRNLKPFTKTGVTSLQHIQLDLPSNNRRSYIPFTEMLFPKGRDTAEPHSWIGSSHTTK